MSLTKRQELVLESYLRTNSQQLTADELGSSRAAIRQSLKLIEKKGMAPWFCKAQTPEHLHQTNTTVQYDGDGNVVQEWKRLRPIKQLQEEIVTALCERCAGKGRAKKRVERKTDTDKILFEIDLFDPHIGMYADKEETLDSDYDCNIASQRMIEAVDHLASRACRPEKTVLVFGGDVQHADNKSNTTTAGTGQDVDSRFHRVVDFVTSACVDAVKIAASVSRMVDVVIVEGNHDWHSSVWLAQVLKAYYSNCDNVTIHMQRSPRKMMVWGSNMLVWTHGGGMKHSKWGQIIPAEFPQEWGRTKFRFLKLGHIHHKKTIAPIYVDEQAGLHVEFLEALASIDAWHVNSGFVGSQKGASAFEYHRDYGLASRFFYNVNEGAGNG